MGKWIVGLFVLLVTLPAFAVPRVSGNNGEASLSSAAFEVNISFFASDTTDSEAIYVRNTCSIRAVVGSGDVLQVWSVPTSTTAATSGSLLSTISATTPVAIPFATGNYYVKVRASTAATSTSTMRISCSNGQVAAAPSDPATLCSTGAVKGGGYDSVTGLYEWACATYPWSAEIGGMDAQGKSAYNTPTTPGGNSWWMTCTGDGTGTPGTAAEQSVCTAAGERIRMYSMADIVLAQDNVRPGGTLYFPPALLHDRYCGRQSNGVTPNGCPITRRSPGHQTRKIQQSRGIKWIFPGQDTDGPHINGRDSGWIISDLGADNDGTTNGSTLAVHVTDPGGTSGYVPGHWGLTVGLSSTVNATNICARTSTTTGAGCDTRTTAVRDQDREGLSNLARNAGLILSDINLNPTEGTNIDVCIDDRLSVGICVNDAGVTNTPCTTNSPTARSADGVSGSCDAASGGPGGTGATCVGAATAIERILERNGDQITNGSSAAAGVYMVLDMYPSASQGSSTPWTGSFVSTFASISNVRSTGSCTNGRVVQLGGMWDARPFMSTTNLSFNSSTFNPMILPYYAVANQPNKIAVVTADRFVNTGGGIWGLNQMPGSWVDRDSTTNTADCLYDNLPGGGSPLLAETACDDVESVALAAGLGGGVYDSAFWYGGGLAGGSATYAFSKVDGDTAGFWVEFKNNLVAKGMGLQTDASGWIYEDNLWMDINGLSTALGAGNSATLFSVGFTPGFRWTRDRFVNLSGGNTIVIAQSDFTSITDLDFHNLTASGAVLSTYGARHLKVDGINIKGYRGGPLVVIGARGGYDSWDIDIQNVKAVNQMSYLAGQSPPKSMVWVTDVNSGTGVISGPVTMRNFSTSVHGDERYCMVFMDGGNGDETTDPDGASAETAAANGSGRTVDDWRHFLTFQNFSLESMSDGSPGAGHRVFCLGQRNITVADSNGPEDGAPYTPLNINLAEGGMPRWENMFLAGVKYPDNPINSVPTSAVPDCDTLPAGTMVLVHDSPTSINTCSDATGPDGVLDSAAAAPNQFTSRCKCNPAGTGAWTSF